MTDEKNVSSEFDGFTLLEDLKAFQAPYDPPKRGDVRPTRDYPAGTLWSEIAEFEVWDGDGWIKPDAPISRS
jgi:hypothetical protein